MIPRQRLPDTEALHEAAARHVLELARTAIAARGAFHVALSGGNTPRGLHARLAREPDVDWSCWHVWFGDERCVPPAHADSNYRMARETLLDHVAIPADQIHPMMPAAEPAPAEAARTYAARLAAEAPQRDERPELDLILLGLGGDGHTASLFPGTDILDERTRNVAEVFVPKLDAWRISLTPPSIERARHLMFLVDGNDKTDILQRLERGPAADETLLPVERLQPQGGVEWYISQPQSY